MVFKCPFMALGSGLRLAPRGGEEEEKMVFRRLQRSGPYFVFKN